MRSLSIAAALAMVATPVASFAALQVGAPAPDFQTQGRWPEKCTRSP